MKLSTILKRMSVIRAYLAERGAEVLEPTNEWEVLRFRGHGITSVVYKNAKNHLTFTGDAHAALDAYFNGKPWRAAPASKRSKKSSTTVAALLARDGDDCFLCGQSLGDDITEEHLVPLTSGGTNHIANKALAHGHCNARMSHLSLMEKIGMREQMIYHRRTECLNDTALTVAAASLKSAALAPSSTLSGCEASAAVATEPPAKLPPEGYRTGNTVRPIPPPTSRQAPPTFA